VTRVVETPVGLLTLEARGGFVTRCDFGDTAGQYTSTGDAADAELLARCEHELRGYFNRKRKIFTVPVKPVGTVFCMRVWEELTRIPYGATASYREVAMRIGDAKAARAVGRANHNNPIAIIIPCHRVIGADGSLVGYGGGLNIKEFLLKLEQM
jgi:methylated-DNA-[protein]-cysteine S-methyltransferase